MKKVVVLVDGQNVYYSLQQLRLDQTEKLGDSFLSIDISKSKEEERCIANAS
jgi:hypothetical protein